MHTQPRFSPGTDEAAATANLGTLLASSGGRWTLTNEGEALERSFKFKTFAKTWVRAAATLLAQGLRADLNQGLHDGSGLAVQGQESPPRVVKCDIQ